MGTVHTRRVRASLFHRLESVSRRKAQTLAPPDPGRRKLLLEQSRGHGADDGVYCEAADVIHVSPRVFQPSTPKMGYAPRGTLPRCTR